MFRILILLFWLQSNFESFNIALEDKKKPWPFNDIQTWQ